MPVGGGRAERGGSRGVIRGGRRDSKAGVGVGVGTGAEKLP